MTHPFETIAKLKDRFPDDVAAIEVEQERVAELLRRAEYSELEMTRELMGLCRKDILAARKRLATERQLTPEERDALWHIVDARLWFLTIVARDFQAEIEEIGRLLEAELAE